MTMWATSYTLVIGTVSWIWRTLVIMEALYTLVIIAVVWKSTNTISTIWFNIWNAFLIWAIWITSALKIIFAFNAFLLKTVFRRGTVVTWAFWRTFPTQANCLMMGTMTFLCAFLAFIVSRTIREAILCTLRISCAINTLIILAEQSIRAGTWFTRGIL